MKKLKVFEYISLLLIFFLGSLITFNYVFGAYTIAPGPGNEKTYPAPKLVTPDLTVPVSGKFAPVVSAPGSLYGEYYLMNAYQSTAVITRNVTTDSAGLLNFPGIDTNSYANGKYFVKFTIYYNTASTNPILNIDKYFDIYNKPAVAQPPNTETAPQPPSTNSGGGGTTDNTTPPSTGSTGGSGSTGSTGSTGGSSTGTGTTAPSTVEQELNVIKNVTGTTEPEDTSTLKEWYEERITETQEAELPEELVKAPVSIMLTTEKAEVAMTTAGKGKVKLTGKGEPNSTIYLYIFSEPIVVSVRTDSVGNWEYSLDQDLSQGKHEVFVAVKDNENNIKAKSMPFSFVVSPAIGASDSNVATPNKAKNNLLVYYIIFVVSVLSLIVSGIFYLLTKSHLRKNVVPAKN